MRAMADKASSGLACCGQQSNPLPLLFVASEIFPLAKTGGLADVCGSLPQALACQGVDIRMLMPGYTAALDRVVAAQTIADLGEILPGIPARLVSGWMPDSGLPVWLVDCPPLYRREGSLYRDLSGADWTDNAIRFAMLNHVAARIATGRAAIGWKPAIVHAHDWHTGLIPMLLSAYQGHRPKTVFTVHNMAFQGLFPLHQAPSLGLPPSASTLDGAEFYGRLSFLKAGIRFADAVTTVSRNYAREIETPEFGCGMDGLVRSRHGATGIMNGIDEHVWNPAIDDFLTERYSADTMHGKQQCKTALQQELGLHVDPSAPIAESVCRLTYQKMADVLLECLPDMMQEHPSLQVVVHGCGDRALEQGFSALADRFPGRIAAHIGYDEGLAHRLHAGADILLHGARFEPCGLTQLYAMRYGTIPVVRHIGGLADSVIDVAEQRSEDGFVGFVFDAATREDLCAAVSRCIDVYKHAPETWERIRRSAMRGDYGWRRSATEYVDLYTQLLPAHAPVGERRDGMASGTTADKRHAAEMRAVGMSR